MPRPSKKAKKLTQKRLFELLEFDSETGVFRSRVSRSYRKWCINVGDIAGALHSSGYWKISIDSEIHYGHRLAWFYVHGSWPVEEIDHINGDKADNRICNLRPATRSQNTRNRGVKSDCLSGFKGVAQRGRRFYAFIYDAGNYKHLGAFDTPEEASRAYATAASRLHGEFARVA